MTPQACRFVDEFICSAIDALAAVGIRLPLLSLVRNAVSRSAH